MAIQQNERLTGFFLQRLAELKRTDPKEGIKKRDIKLFNLRGEQLKVLAGSAKAIAVELYLEDEKEVKAQAREAMKEVKASRKRSQKTGREIKKLETKTR